ncbi:DUF2812 domain-containing protein [Lysinibacillus sphaericus]|uniref:DUF2812 domain-containing protein n=1 Tax=Lysinibacillus sphaericus OT4b.31 TaxID=1285586 RepID=R7ZEZ1_LYSSH|nr:DUF2812 domain-containing protein [Lysinibacillus sphaericus]EON72653.1 hypothetical protein H131_10948 [Lysinibacillus sphaericus OT4b.31]
MKLIKFRFYIDHEHEEKWVNTMAETGWHLKKFWPFVYLFEKGNPSEYIYRNEMVIKRKKDYYEFLKTMGVECVHSFGVWAYFRKRREDGPFEIFSGKLDKIKDLSRLNTLFMFAALVNVLVLLINIVLPLLRHEVHQEVLWASSLNMLMLALLYIGIHRNNKRKKKLQMHAHIFED